MQTGSGGAVGTHLFGDSMWGYINDNGGSVISSCSDDPVSIPCTLPPLTTSVIGPTTFATPFSSTAGCGIGVAPNVGATALSSGDISFGAKAAGSGVWTLCSGQTKASGLLAQGDGSLLLYGVSGATTTYTTPVGALLIHPATATVAGFIQQPSIYAFAGIPTCHGGAGSTQASEIWINDATVNTWGTAITVGGGGLVVKLGCDGSNWTVIGK